MTTQAESLTDISHARGCGQLLRQAREQAGLSLPDIAARLKMPLKVLQALEEERWERLGAPVFVRGQLRSYARLLCVDIQPYLEQAQLQCVQPAELVSRTHTPRYRRVLESIARRAVYVVLTAAIAVPVWVATQWDNDDVSPQPTASLDIPSTADPSSRAPASPAPAAASGRNEGAPPPPPFVASLTPALPRVPGNALVLRTQGDSWIQIFGPDGASLEKGMLRAGEQRSFKKGEIGRVVIGNAAVVEVQQNGSTVDLTAYRRANVVRFAVSSDGSLAPVVD
jgi:cytoskeleton protein RodZ